MMLLSNFNIQGWMIAVAILVVLVLWFVMTYNSLVKLRTSVEEAFSTIDVYLQKRFDLIPNLVATVKGYAAHEKETLENVIRARNLGMSANTPEEKMAASNEMNSALARLMVVVEQYPNLKADTQFQALMAELSTLEGEIANYRKFYNATVKNYNIKIASIPSNIVAGMTGFKPAELFELTDVAARTAPEVSFE